MKDKLFIKALVCILTFLMLIPAPATFASAVDEVSEITTKLLDFKIKELDHKNVQGFIDEDLTDNAGILSEWYVIALASSGNYDFSAYESALVKYIKDNPNVAASTKQKYALALLAIGSENEYVASILDSTVAQQGIMSYVFALHLVNNGQTSAKISKEELILTLLELELESGGWALSGKNADVDVSAMVVQALAPYYKEDSRVQEKVDRALGLLSQKQLDNGDFLSYGVANPESAAQVMIALCSLGIDFESDERFIKNSNTLLDSIKRFQLENGSFCHQIGKGANENATSQVFLAAIAYQNFKNGRSSIFIFDKKQTETPPTTDSTTVQNGVDTAPQTEPVQESETDEPKQEKKYSYKLVASACIAALGALVFIILVVTKRANGKNIAAVLILASILLALVYFLDIQKPSDYYTESAAPKSDPVGTVKISIRCDKIADEVGRSVILEPSEFEIEDGDTVYTILIEAAKKYGIHIENNGNDKMAYIAGIDNIYEMDHGDLSGWIYTVNGSSVSVGCSDYELSDGDVIVWEYTLELGIFE